MRKVFIILIAIVIQMQAFGQDSTALNKKVSFSTNVDVVSRYLWRGLLLNSNPNIQPYASLSLGSFSLGAWGSYGLSDKYAEVDLYLSYSIGNLLLTVSDYYALVDEDQPLPYFKFTKKETNHAIEGAVNYIISDKFPLTLTAATFFYGNDYPVYTDSIGDNYYSTYLELAYPFTIDNCEFNAFVGGTISEGYYSTGANMVNVGLSFTKQVPLTDKFKLPISATLAVNPNSENIFFVVKITL